MLRKLIKYEFKATGRIFFPLYLALIIIAFIQRLFFQFNIENMGSIVINILSLIVPSLFGAIVMAICVVTFVMTIQRFYKNMLGREGYLMFTLPVSVSKLIWSKLIVVMVWIILSVIVGSVAFMIVIFNFNDLKLLFSEFGNMMSQIFSGGIGFISIMIEGILLVLAACASEVLSIYLCMAIGQLSDKHKGLCAVGAYIGISIIVGNVVFAIIAGADSTPFVLNLVERFLMPMDPIQAMNVTLIAMLLFCLIEATVYFLVTKYLLTKKLNLE